jgi:rRNA biogenesis protein RRP5
MNLTDRGMFVSISGNVHAVIWPNHYADIRLKHPERKFKVGKSIKCRVCPQLSRLPKTRALTILAPRQVLVVDPEKNRICLTAKKTLMESTLPIISNVADVEVGAVAHATIFKVSERYLSVEFYNGVRGIIPMKEAT